MKLDLSNKKLLWLLDQNSRTPDSQLAKQLRKSKDSVRYRIQQLEKSDVIRGYHTWLDLTKLGYESYKIYLKLAASSKKREVMIHDLCKEKCLFALFSADGSWDIGLSYFAKNHQEFYALEQTVLGPYENIIIEKKICNMVDATVCTKDFLTGVQGNHYTLWGASKNNELDELERVLLKTLYKNARQSLVRLAQTCNTTVERVRTRMKRLQKIGVIAQYIIDIDYSKLDLEFYKAFVYTHQITPTKEQALLEKLTNHPNIVHVIRMIGPWRYELEILVKNYQEYNKIINDLRSDEAILNVDSAIMNDVRIFPSEKLIFENETLK